MKRAELSGLSQRMEEAVATGVFPGAVLWVQEAGRCVHASAHGKLRTDKPGPDVTLETCFDLASLTKVLSTAALMMDVLSRGRIALDAPVTRFLPGFADERVTLSHLLEHRSGLIAWRPFFEEIAAAAGGNMLATAKGRDAIRGMVLAERPLRDPGSAVEYSDLGFILLDWILEKATGQSCDRLFDSRIRMRLNIPDLFFIDLKSPREARRRRGNRVFAATECCPWRERTLVGEVHDDNTYAMGGVSGHAGLFGTAEGVATLAQSWLEAWHGRGMAWPPELLRLFWKPSLQQGSTRTLGFDRPALKDSQAGSKMGPKTVGHLGFTGTSLWIDPEAERMIILLSNRVHPSRENEKIKTFRPGLHDLVIEACTK